MTGIALKILLSALPFFKEMIFGKKTKVEKITGVAMFLCFLIAILFMIIANSFNYNLGLNKKNKTLLDENIALHATIKTLEGNKLLNVCPDSKILISELQSKLGKTEDKLDLCMKDNEGDHVRLDDVKEALKGME